jgi:hypothetical protein
MTAPLVFSSIFGVRLAILVLKKALKSLGFKERSGAALIPLS